MAKQRLSLTRDQFASFLNDFEQIKQFESLFSTVDNIDTFTLDEINVAAGTANATANEALASIAALSNLVAPLIVAPPPTGGTVTSVAASGGTTGMTFTGSPITTSGTFTLGGTLAIANGGTNGTATPTAGGVAYGTGTAYDFSTAGTAGQFLTSTGGSTPTWSTISTPSIGQSSYYGSFYDITASQVAANTTTAYAIQIGQTAENNGVTIASGDEITFAHSGVYNVQYSIQFTNTDNAIHNVNIWLRKNGVDVADSNSQYAVIAKHGSIHGQLIAAVNYVLTVTAGDYLQLMWQTEDVKAFIETIPAGTTPTTPVAPGVIVTVCNLPDAGIGYAGLTSTTSMAISTGSKSFTVSINSANSAFVVGNRVRLIYDTTNYMEGTVTAYSGTSMTVNVDTTAGSGTYAAWTIGLTGVVNTGVTSFSGGSTGLTPATATSGVVTLAGTLGVGNGGTGQASYTNGQLLIGNTTGNTLTKATLTAGTNVSITNGSGSITINATDQYVGTVTSVSVVSANGFAGTVATATTTPAITLSTSVNGLVKGNGTALSAAVAATDYVAPSAYASANGLTMATSRLLGRTTASTGAAEEISVAGGLTLSGGVLTGASGTVTSVTGTSPVVSSGGSTPAISMPAATTSVNGYLTSTDWTTFNNKGSGTVTSVSGTGTVNGITLTGTITSSGSLTLGGTLSGVSLTTQVSGTLPIANGGTNGTSAPTAGAVPYGTGTAYAFTAAGTSGQVLTSAGAGVPTWTTPTTGTVTSVSGTGTVNGITLTGTVTSTGSLTLGGTLSGVSLTTQVSGTLPVANGGTGTATAFTAGSVVFAGASGVYTQDNASLFWNDASNLLGIGTATPAGKQHTQLATSFAWGGFWNSGVAAFGGASLSTGAIAISYNDTDGGAIGSIIPGVAWKPIKIYSDFFAVGTGGTTERMRVDSSGNVGIGITSPVCALDVVGGIKTSRTTVTAPATTDGNVFSGTYTPTAFNTTNVAASTPQSAQYLRVGNSVTVSGQIDIDPTATGFTILGLSLPIASALTSAVQLSGVFNCPDADGGGIYGDAANDRATFQMTATSAANLTYYYTFTYRVL